MNPLTKKPFSAEYYELQKNLKKNLPIYREDVVKEFTTKLEENDVVVLTSSTGSGKSIGTPILALKKYNYNNLIIITQPRVINIVDNADFIAKQLDVKLGEEVGYMYGGGRKFKIGVTKIIVVIDSIYVRILKLIEHREEEKQLKIEGIKLKDEEVSYLTNPNIIMIDEFHERSLHMDLMLVTAAHHFKTRSIGGEVGIPYKFVLLSATIDVNVYRDYFIKYGAKTATMEVWGKTQPIKHYYLKNSVIENVQDAYTQNDIKKITEEIMNQVKKLILEENNANVLIFVPTVALCYKMVISAEGWAKEKGLYNGIYFDALSSKTEESLKNFIIQMVPPVSWKDHFDKMDPKERGVFKQKIIFSTPTSETGITVKGINYVIESGLQNFVRYNAKERRKYQSITRTSQSSVTQRCGRAGRLGPGNCIHIYTEDEYRNPDNFKADPVPAIEKQEYHVIIINLLKIYGTVDKVLEVLNYLPNPINQPLVRHTLNELYKIGIITAGKLSDVGDVITNLGVDFKYGQLILKSLELNIIEHMLPIIMFMHIKDNPLDWYVGKDRNKFINQYRNNVGNFLVYYKMWIKFQRECLRYSGSDRKIIKWCRKNDFNHMLFRKFIRAVRKTERRLHEHKGKLIIKEREHLEFGLYDKMRYIFMRVYNDNRFFYEQGVYNIIEYNKITEQIKSGRDVGGLQFLNVKGRDFILYGYGELLWMGKGRVLVTSPFIIK